MAPATAFTHMPKEYSFAEAATLTTAGVTAWRALIVDGALKAGETVLILGTGGVSIFRAANRQGYGSSLSLQHLPPTRSWSGSAPLEQIILSTTVVIRIGVLAFWQWTSGSGVDHVVEVGGPGTLAQSITAVAIGGHIALIGVLTGRAGEIPTGNLAIKQIRLHGVYSGQPQASDRLRSST